VKYLVTFALLRH